VPSGDLPAPKSFSGPGPVDNDVGSSDEALLAGLAAGDPDSAAAFVRRFQRPVFGLALTVLHDRGAAEDVAQEVFVRAWRNAGGYDPRRGAVLAWLLGITRNAAIDVLRLKRADPVDPDVFASRLQLDADPGSPPALEDREQLRGLIGALAPEQRRALVLAAYFGRTAREISELENVPLGTAKTRIRSAMMRLRDGLEVSDEH
jgi:RNA polymerase sigma factor (sigma-70 family)